MINKTLILSNIYVQIICTFEHKTYFLHITDKRGGVLPPLSTKIRLYVIYYITKYIIYDKYI